MTAFLQIYFTYLTFFKQEFLIGTILVRLDSRLCMGTRPSLLDLCLADGLLPLWMK